MHLFFLLLLLGLTACSSLPTAQERRLAADDLAHSAGWESRELLTRTFDLRAYVPRQIGSLEHLVIYIEGDGLAWRTPSLPSDDPTPNKPIGLKLALAHPDGKAVYLARPCQYGQANKKSCGRKYWTDARFAPEVINATSQAIDQLKQRFGARRVTLVGYSGGGAVAALVAAGRNDVEKLITVAGNLNHRVWTQRHRLTPLSGSLNPADDTQRLARVHQWHFVGGEDKVILPALVQGYADRFPEKSKPFVAVEPDFDHHCCWVENWARLYSSTL